MQALSLRRSTLTPRLFQQACRLSTYSLYRLVGKQIEKSPSGSKPKTKKTKRPARPVQKPQRPPQNDDESSIRWFEKDVETGEVRRVAGNPEEMEAEELRQKIKSLEQELKEYESPDQFGFDKALLDALEPQERAKVQKALAEQSQQVQDVAGGLEVRLELPPLTGPILKKFNESIRVAAVQPKSVQTRKQLWRWYSRAKYHLPGLSRMMPEKAWNVLWTTQSIRADTNPDRLTHIVEILDDMATARIEWTSHQKEERSEALLLLDRQGDAIAEWEADYDSTAGRDLQVLELGIKLFAGIGNIDRALTLVREAFENTHQTDPRIVVPLISASLQAGNNDLAYSLYMIMRSKLKERIQMSDYDMVSLLFLANGQRDLALAVFRDMMTHGDSAIKKELLTDKQQKQLYNSVFRNLDFWNSITTDATEVKKTLLYAMSSLPVQWQNKYFFGSWIKKLIGMDQINAASQVVELMFERGIVPDSRHLNGLIGAFFRCDDPEMVATGERLGWAMIQKRLDFVSQRGENVPGRSRLSVGDTPPDVKLPIQLARPVPRATIETFNVLALHYLVTHRYPHMAYLDQMVAPCALRIDAHYMNQMLYKQLYSKGPPDMWRALASYARSALPDMETFNCLWTAETRYLATKVKKSPRPGNSEWFPMPRRLYLSMIKWQQDMSDKQRASAKADMTIGIAGSILQSFCTIKDFVGCLIAMHSLHQVFGVAPNAEIARLIITAIANLPERQPGQMRVWRGQRKPLDANLSRTDDVAKVLDALRKRREAAALENRVDVGKLTRKEREIENLNLFSELIRVVLIRSGMDVDRIEPSIEEASTDMGVPGIPTGDVDASNVA